MQTLQKQRQHFQFAKMKQLKSIAASKECSSFIFCIKTEHDWHHINFKMQIQAELPDPKGCTAKIS